MGEIRERASETIIGLGIHPNRKGFDYIGDAIEVFDCSGNSSIATMPLYEQIAEKRNTAPSRVERAIRAAIEVAYSNGDKDAWNKYFGLSGNKKPKNKEFLAMLYFRISRAQ
jgi:two-component system response regulator (stage 0 sporulation protein A)